MLLNAVSFKCYVAICVITYIKHYSILLYTFTWNNNVPFQVLVLAFPGVRQMPGFAVTVNSKLCKTIRRTTKKDSIRVRCAHKLLGRTVKIKLLRPGRISLCEVEIYGKHG